MAQSALFDNRDWREAPMGELLTAGQKFLDTSQEKHETGSIVEAYVADTNFAAVWKEIVRRHTENA